jgi:hypothetical protein
MSSTKEPYNIPFLIRCRYDTYCQGYEETSETFLVYSNSFEDACRKLTDALKDAHSFENLTID